MAVERTPIGHPGREEARPRATDRSVRPGAPTADRRTGRTTPPSGRPMTASNTGTPKRRLALDRGRLLDHGRPRPRRVCLWRCVCDWSYAYQNYFCGWREVARNRDITKLPKPENYARRPVQGRMREWAWVRCSAYHASTGGVSSTRGNDDVWFVRRHGSEG